jgi:hypothetical protein
MMNAIPEHLLIPKDASPAWLQARYDVTRPEDLAVLVAWSKNCANIDANIQVSALLAAGWRFELPGDDSEPWQWYWRAPPKRKGSKGRKYLSTNQAHNALLRG